MAYARLVSLVVLTFAFSLPHAGCGGSSDTITLQGSGASFPAPIYSRWFKEYNRANPDVRVNYQSVGSGAGVKAFIAEQTDFGASDAAMKDGEIAQVKRGAVLLPMTAGSIVLAYNLPGVKELKLSRDAYSGIFLGKIKNWNDPKITESNPGLSLPDQSITIVRRSDGSGTTYVFTKHLAEISAAWRAGPGVGKSISWLGNNVGGKKNDGVAALLKQTEGSIGYVEYGFAVSTSLSMASLENKDGHYIHPSPETAQAALANVTLPSNMIAWVSDPSGANSYPIVTYTWMLIYKQYADAKKVKALKQVLKWCLNDGQKLANELHYIPLPRNVVEVVSRAVDGIATGASS